MNGRNSSILICQCERARVFPAGALEQVCQRLSEAGVAFETVPDLCELAARGDGRLAPWAAGSVKIAACAPRAVRWLFAAAGAPLSDSAELVNLREGVAEEKISALLSGGQGAVGSSTPGTKPFVSPTEAPPADWPAWFPVIDYDRCVQCMQCLGFCLFGVYGVDADKNIQVINPAQCKTNCPACARVCPHGAIMFPKHKTGPINGQDEGVSAAPAQSGAKIDISALLGGDAHALLRDRTARAKSRFSKERTQEQALSERRKFLAQQSLIAEDVPPEILQSLPSAEEIARKVEEAAARAKAAREARGDL